MTRASRILLACIVIVVFSSRAVPSRALRAQGGARPTGGSGAAAPAEIAQSNGFILGRAVGARGQLVADAIVTLRRYGDLPGGLPGGAQAAAPVTSQALNTPSSPRRVITNSDGYFLFRELPGGRFSLLVVAMGYVGGGYLQNR